MSNFSFTSFLNNNNGGTNGSSAYSRPASENQKKFYFDLCERKRIAPKNINGFTFDQLRKEIEELQMRPDPASERQIAKIKELQDEIIKLGGDLKPIGDDVIARLTGGRDGNASALIQKLFDMRTKMNVIAPPTDAQLQIMVEWYLCPDVPFEEFSSEEVFAMEHGANENQSRTITISIKRRVELGGGLWRHMTPNEFAEALKKSMTKKQASKFIDDYRGVFYDWKKTRITQPQINYIRELELRLANVETPRAVEFAIVDGEMQQITNNSVDYDGDWNPMAYEPMDELVLMQMSADDATNWINQLKSEVGRRNAYESMYNEEEVYGTSQQDFEETQLVRGENRRVKNAHDAKHDEWRKLNDLIYSLEAIAGYKSDEIHDMVQELVIDEVDSDKALEYKYRMKEFFMSTVTADPTKDRKRWESEMARVFNMCEEVPVALEILALA